MARFSLRPSFSTIADRRGNEWQVLAIEGKQELAFVVLKLDHRHVQFTNRRFASSRVEPVRRRNAYLVHIAAKQFLHLVDLG